MTELKIYNRPEHVAVELAEFFYALVKEYQKKGKKINVALSGGSTPKLWFKQLADQYKDKIDWNQIHFYWGDERMVPADSIESNFGEAKRYLFEHIPIPDANIHPVNGTNQVNEEVKRYTEMLINNLDNEEGKPVFDLVILGMGDDGHTASIFPNQMDLIDSDAACSLAYHPETRQLRITITTKVINKARYVVFLITGESKAEVLKSVFNQDDYAKQYPAAYVLPDSNQLYFFIDSEAAQKIF